MRNMGQWIDNGLTLNVTNGANGPFRSYAIDLYLLILSYLDVARASLSRQSAAAIVRVYTYDNHVRRLDLLA